VIERPELRDPGLTADESAALVAAAEFLLRQQGALPPEFKGALVGAIDKMSRTVAGA
jgi:hypothetical protein